MVVVGTALALGKVLFNTLSSAGVFFPFAFKLSPRKAKPLH